MHISICDWWLSFSCQTANKIASTATIRTPLHKPIWPESGSDATGEVTRDDCNGCGNQDAISSTVATDGSSVDTADVAMFENGRDDYSGCNDQDTPSIVVMADGSIVDMADVVRVYERDDCDGRDDESAISSNVAADGSGVDKVDKAVWENGRDGRYGSDNENAILSTVAADGSGVCKADKAVWENGRDDDDQSAGFKMWYFFLL